MADLLDGVRDVLGEALAQGGTSFDSLYVDVNGQSGYFSRFLAVYGQARPALPALRDADPPGVVHEPVQLQLPDLPAPPAGAAVVSRAGRRRRLRARAGRRVPLVRARARHAPPDWPVRRRNLPDGRVEVVLEGADDDVASARRRARRPARARARVSRVDVRAATRCRGAPGSPQRDERDTPSTRGVVRSSR